GAARLLRLPRRALDPPADVQPHRIDVLSRAGAHEPDEGAGIETGRTGHVLQADRSGRREVEAGQRAGARGARSSGCEVRERTVGRAGRPGGCRVTITGFRSTTLDYSSNTTDVWGYELPGSADSATTF